MTLKIIISVVLVILLVVLGLNHIRRSEDKKKAIKELLVLTVALMIVPKIVSMLMDWLFFK